jgi:hypothetical protein
LDEANAKEGIPKLIWNDIDTAFAALTPTLFNTSSSSHLSMPHLNLLPLRSSDLSFEAAITGTAPSGEGAKPAKLYSSGVLDPGTQCCAVLSNVRGSRTGAVAAWLTEQTSLTTKWACGAWDQAFG